MTNQNPFLATNVISKEMFDSRSERVFDFVADTLANTLGPYGSTTIIETHNDYKVTKDGWNVLKALHFSNPVEENILMLLVNIAQRVVRKVGDGSTSSVVAARHLLNTLVKYTKENKVRSKVLLDDLKYVTELLVEEIQRSNKRVDMEGDFQEVYDLAHISTNGNDEIATLLQQAYQETRSTSIQYAKSRSSKNELEVIEGYQSKIAFLDPIFVNTDNETGVYNNPLVLMFDHTVEKEYHLDFIMDLYMKANAQSRPLLIIAPYYDNAMHETFGYICNKEKNEYGEHHMLVSRAALLTNHEKNMFKDLSALLGAKIVTENIINEYKKKTVSREERERTYDTRISGEANEYIEINPADHLGAVGTVTLGKRFTLFQDFVNVNTHELEMCKLDAANKLKAQQERDEETAIINHEGFNLEERVIKLRCKTAIIKAGGSTTLEKGANYDLLEDAVKAAASAVKHGFNLGGNLSIMNAVETLQQRQLENKVTLTAQQIELINRIDGAFFKVLEDVVTNAQTDIKAGEILDNAALGKGCYNLVTGEYDGKVINPTMTDVEILRGAISIVSMMASSNQYISLSPTIEVV